MSGTEQPVDRRRAPFGVEYARIAVGDLAASIGFYEYHAGLQLEGHDEEYAHLRADVGHHNIELVATPGLAKAEVRAVGLSVESELVLDDLGDRVSAAGCEVLELPGRMKDLCSRGFGVRDPNGLTLELFTGFAEYAEPPGIELRPTDLVHPFISTDRYEESLTFYVDVLGFQPSDFIAAQTAFLRSEDRYHHSFAIRRDESFYVAHLCFRMQSFDHVMRARARALYKSVPIASDLVNHSASTSIAFYLHDTAHGPRIELCDRHRVLTPGEHETHRPRRMSVDPRNIDVWRAAADDWGRL